MKRNPVVPLRAAASLGVLLACVTTPVTPPLPPGPGKLPPTTRPSDIFFDGKQNSKDPGSIVARDVEIAGWILGGHFWNCDDGSASCEDIHYEIELDPDWIEERYKGSPLTSAFLPGYFGQRVPPGKQMPLSDYALDGKPLGITINSFLLPGAFVSEYNSILTGKCDAVPKEEQKACQARLSGINFHVELNAWNKDSEGTRIVGRGEPPAGWRNRPDIFPNAYFPYDPDDPDGKGELKEGDYVILKGTLWLDVAHLGRGPLVTVCRIFGGLACKINTPIDLPEPLKDIPSNFDLEQQACWDRDEIPPDPARGWPQPRVMKGNASWLEMHPPDSIRRVPPPPRKGIGGLVLCAPVFFVEATRSSHFVIAAPPRPSGNAQLRFREYIDGRYTDWRTVERHHVRVVDDTLQGDITVRSYPTTSQQGRKQGRFKAVYSVWWEDPGSECSQLRGELEEAERILTARRDAKARLDPRSDPAEVAELASQVSEAEAHRAGLQQRFTGLRCSR